MSAKKQKCPVCTTRMKMINGILTCPECGYYLRNSENDSSPYNGWVGDGSQQSMGHAAPGSDSSKTRENRGGGSKVWTNTTGNNRTGRNRAGETQAGKKKHRVVITGVIIFLINFILPMAVSFYSARKHSGSVPAYQEEPKENHLDTAPAEDWFPDFGTEAIQGSNASGETFEEVRYPEGSFSRS